MARRKARLTLKKKVVKKIEKQVPGGLSLQQFTALLHDYGSCIIEDANHEEHVFALGDTVYVQHQDLEDEDVVPAEDYWIGEVKDIKGNNPGDVWVKVQWFWAPEEVAEVIKSFDPTICGKHEKLSSNNYDIISVHCIVDHVDVKSFDESSIYQVSIGDDEWFYRFEFSYDSKRIAPKVTNFACSRCKITYTPGKGKVLHFCPRPSCRKFYHQSCLEKGAYVNLKVDHRPLETWPDIDRDSTAEDLCAMPPAKRLKTDDCTLGKRLGCNKDPLAAIPRKLLAVAEQPMMRGSPEWGIVGNITAVAAARTLIYNTLSRDGVIPDDWESKMDISAAFPLAKGPYTHFFCPSCYSAI